MERGKESVENNANRARNLFIIAGIGAIALGKSVAAFYLFMGAVLAEGVARTFKPKSATLSR